MTRIAWLGPRRCSAAARPEAAARPRSTGSRHIVVIYAENRSFDNLYGLFPGANGIANATPEQKTQLDHDGKPLPRPAVGVDAGRQARPALSAHCRTGRSASTRRRSNRRIDADRAQPDPRLLPQQEQINGGKNNMFAAMSNVGGWTMGYYDGSPAADCGSGRRIHAGRQLLHGRVRRLVPEPPVAGLRLHAALSERAGERCARSSTTDGKLKKQPDSPSAGDGAVQRAAASAAAQVTPDGYASTPRSRPTSRAACRRPPAAIADLADPSASGTAPLPPQTREDDRRHAVGQGRVVGLVRRRLERGARRRPRSRRRRSARSSTRATTAARTSSRTTSRSTTSRASRPGTPDRARAPEGRRRPRCATSTRGTLPPVAFYKPAGRLPSIRRYTDLQSGDAHIAELLEQLRDSPQWNDMLVDRHLRRERRLLGPRAAAAGPGLGRPLGPGHAHPDDHRLAAAQARLRRPRRPTTRPRS